MPAGTPLVVRLEQTVSAKNSNVGDSFSGVLAQSVVVGGVSVIRAGAPVTGVVTASKGQGRFKGSGDLAIAIKRVGDYAVSTTAYEATTKGKGKRTAGFVGGGAGGGALIGGLAGGGKGALIGGLLGAGAGTAGAAFTGNKDITVPAESVVTFKLAEPITVTEESRLADPRVPEVGLPGRSKLQILQSITRVTSDESSLLMCSRSGATAARRSSLQFSSGGRMESDPASMAERKHTNRWMTMLALGLLAICLLACLYILIGFPAEAQTVGGSTIDPATTQAPASPPRTNPDVSLWPVTQLRWRLRPRCSLRQLCTPIRPRTRSMPR